MTDNTTTRSTITPATIFARDERIVEIVEYLDGFVPNSYKWPAPGTRIIHRRDGSSYTTRYDRKRKRGQGPAWVAMSAAGGRLISG